MKKLVKVHMLPTEDKSHIAIMRSGNKLMYIKEPLDLNNGFQHLHFTSDEKPEEGDWFIRNVGSILAVEQYIKDDHLYANDRKIVATTDKSLCNLKQNGHLGQAIIPLPQISQQDQEAYVKAGGFDEVYLEYEEWTELLKHRGDDFVHSQWTKKVPFNSYIGKVEDRLKTDSNNCVITSPVEKKMYTREEVIEICKTISGLYNVTDFNKLTNWIKENL